MNSVIKLSSPATGDFWEIPVVFEDAHLLALAKPARLLTSPDRYDPNRPNLMKLLHRDIARGAPWVKERQLTYLANAHRLDFETSGLILLAKSKPILIRLADQFGSERPVKTYAALVHGSPPEDRWTIERKIGPHPTKIGVVRIDDKNGKKSRTEFVVLERFRKHALVQCFPATGRTHQIRVHLLNSRLPLVADALYGGRPLKLSELKNQYRIKPGAVERPLLDRVALHAESLELPHPETGAALRMTCPWPKDLTVAVRYLRRYSATGMVPRDEATERERDESQ